MLVMPAAAAAAVATLRTEQATDRLRLGAAYMDHDLVFCRADGRPSRRQGVYAGFQRACKRAGIGAFHPHELRHTHVSVLKGRGVASDATFRARREDGAVGDGGSGTAGWRPRRRSEPAGQDGRDRTVLRQMPGCCAHSGCVRRKHDAARGTKKRSNEGRCHQRPVVTLTHSAGLVNRSLPVVTPGSTWRSSPTAWGMSTRP